MLSLQAFSSMIHLPPGCFFIYSETSNTFPWITSQQSPTYLWFYTYDQDIFMPWKCNQYNFYQNITRNSLDSHIVISEEKIFEFQIKNSRWFAQFEIRDSHWSIVLKLKRNSMKSKQMFMKNITFEYLFFEFINWYLKFKVYQMTYR